MGVNYYFILHWWWGRCGGGVPQGGHPLPRRPLQRDRELGGLPPALTTDAWSFPFMALNRLESRGSALAAGRAVEREGAGLAPWPCCNVPDSSVELPRAQPSVKFTGGGVTQVGGRSSSWEAEDRRARGEKCPQMYTCVLCVIPNLPAAAYDATRPWPWRPVSHLSPLVCRVWPC